MKSVARTAVIGFPGQGLHDGRVVSFHSMSVERFRQLNKFEIVAEEQVDSAATELAFPAIRADDEFSTLDIDGVRRLCDRLSVDAIIVGYYTTSSKEQHITTNSSQSESGEVTTSYVQSIVQTIPRFDVCMIGKDGSLMFRAVSEGKRAGFWNAFWDLLVGSGSESPETFNDRIEDALDGICTMLEDRL